VIPVRLVHARIARFPIEISLVVYILTPSLCIHSSPTVTRDPRQTGVYGRYNAEPRPDAYASGGVEQYLSKDVRCSQCHFIPDDYIVREGKSGKIKSLVWTAKSHSNNSVEVAHAPVTPNPVGRSLARGLSALVVTPPLPVPSPTSGVLASA
jgi:hypothetical protein